MLNLSIILEDSAKRFPSKTAFTFTDEPFTYAQINETANRVANGLKKIGIKAGDKVALSCPNLPEFPIIYFGILKAGAIVVPLNVLLKKDEIEYHLKDSDAKAYFCYSGTADLQVGEAGYETFKSVKECEHFFLIMSNTGMPSTINGARTFNDFIQGESSQFETYPTTADDTCVIIYTSGTTGRPKGAELTHVNLLLNAISMCDLMECQSEDVVLIALPLFHIFGMTVSMNAAIYRGCSIILMSRFDADASFCLMQKYGVTMFAGVPTMYWGLLNYTNPIYDYHKIAKSLRLCVSGGGSLPVKMLEDFEKRFKIPIIESYGMSEGSPVVTFNQPKIGRKPGSIGTAFWGVEVKLVDADGREVPLGEKGELLYKGHNVMKGYYKKPGETENTLRNGWLHSGDIAIKDEDGFIYIVDRIKDMINRAGMKVYPREIEEIIIKHEAVSLVAVIGIPHEELGEEVKAYVVLKEGKSITELELISWTKERVASYKYPRRIEFLKALPTTATGKILKRELRK